MNSPWWRRLLDDSLQPQFEDGVWRLHPQEKSQFFAEYLPDTVLEALLRRVRSDNWRSAVEALLPKLKPRIAAYTRDYFLEPYRAGFVDSMDLQGGSVVLDLGCGWGFASQRCLEKGAYVVGTDNALGRLQFCRHRFEQEGFSDRFLPIELDANQAFPFTTQSFDAVIVSGLMEWLPSSTRGAPEDIQRRFLRQCSDVLRPQGQLYLAIENRWWWKYFVGARDLHRVHKLQVLTSILPRRLADVWSRLLMGRAYRTYTYSFLEYLTLLRDAGFAVVNADYPEPDYVQPKRLRELCRGLSLKESSSNLLSTLKRQGSPLLLRRLGRSFMFVATK
jgi:SAM-dependent methyltransferase